MTTLSHPSERRSSGFTLIEVLLAVTIMGIILTTVYGALSRTLTSKFIGEERAELFSNGRDAVLKMASDIEGASRPGVGDRIYFRGNGGRGQVPTLEFVGMNRGGYGIEQVRAGRVLIVYTLDPIPDQSGLFALRREEHLFAALLAEADGTQAFFEDEDETPAPVAVASYLLDCPQIAEEIVLPGSCARVVGLRFRYFEGVNGAWVDEWDSTEESRGVHLLPLAVEISLLMADERGVVHDFSTIVDLPLAGGQPTPGPESEEAEDEDTAAEDADDADDV